MTVSSAPPLVEDPVVEPLVLPEAEPVEFPLPVLPALDAPDPVEAPADVLLPALP